MADCLRALGTEGIGSNLSLFILKRSMVVILAASFSLGDLGSIPRNKYRFDVVRVERLFSVLQNLRSRLQIQDPHLQHRESWPGVFWESQRDDQLFHQAGLLRAL